MSLDWIITLLQHPKPRVCRHLPQWSYYRRESHNANCFFGPFHGCLANMKKMMMSQRRWRSIRKRLRALYGILVIFVYCCYEEHFFSEQRNYYFFEIFFYNQSHDTKNINAKNYSNNYQISLFIYTVTDFCIKFIIKVYEVICIYSIWNLIYAIMNFKVVGLRKVSLKQKYIILLSRIGILLLEGSFEREKIIFHERNLKQR